MIHFITFADSAYQFQATMLRISLYLSVGRNNFNFKCYTPKELEALDYNHDPLVSSHKRGYGLWSWKIPIILDYLNTMPDGDIVWYLDSTILVLPGIKDVKFLDHQKLYLTPNIFDEPLAWSKYANYLPSNYIEYLKNGSIVDAAYIGILKDSFALTFFNSILNSSWTAKYYLEDDAEIFSARFISHRHDQSLVSYFIWLNNISLSMPLTHHLLESPALYHGRLRKPWSRHTFIIILVFAIYYIKSIIFMSHFSKNKIRKTVTLPVSLLGLSRFF